MGDIEIRSIEVADTDAYVALLARIDAESSFLLWEPGERTLTADAVRGRVASADPTRRLHLVAADGEELVGFLVALRGEVRRLRHRCDFTMAVVEARAGEGIGTALLAALEVWARDLYLARIELSVVADNDRAIALYERCGFVLEGTKRLAIAIDGRAVDELVMGKLLGPSTGNA